jgi:hypothetical protein
MAKKRIQGLDLTKVDTKIVSPDAGTQQPSAPSSGSVDGVVTPPEGDFATASEQTNGGPLATDIPGSEDLPADVRERLLKARRDPTKAAPVKVTRQAQVIQVGAPGEDDIFRTYHDSVGWFPVHIVAIKKGFGMAGSKKVYLVGDNALKNVAVAQRVRDGVAILTVTTESIFSVWVIGRPDMVAAPASYPYDIVKWQCAEAAMTNWVSFAWNKELGIHQWSVINLDGQPNATPVRPAEHPLVLIDRAIAPEFVDDPDFPEFKHLVVKKTSL